MAASAVLIATPCLATESPAAAQPAAQGTAAPLTEAERAQAIQDLQDLKARMNALEARLGVAPPSPTQVTPALPEKARDHNLELYGFIQLDAIQDFKRVNPDWDATLRPSRIPTQQGQFGGDGQSIFSVRQSRLGAKATGILAGKPYEAKFEFDLFGTGVDAGQTTFRVRHMYAKWGPFLVGQTNTLFMDGDIFPNVLDYWGPTGMVFVRNPQIRWTFLDSDGWEAAVALEHPSDDIDTGQPPPDRRGHRRQHSGERGTSRSDRGGPLRRRLGPCPARRHPPQDRLRNARTPENNEPAAIRPAGASMRRPRSSSAWRRRGWASSMAAASRPT